MRYVERNALRAGLVRRALDWRWSSLWQRLHGPDDWPGRVNRAETAPELDALRRSVVRGSPFGHTAWVEQTAKRLGLEATLRRQGRPRKGIALDGQ
jgi:putative transposase